MAFSKLYHVEVKFGKYDDAVSAWAELSMKYVDVQIICYCAFTDNCLGFNSDSAIAISEFLQDAEALKEPSKGIPKFTEASLSLMSDVVVAFRRLLDEIVTGIQEDVFIDDDLIVTYDLWMAYLKQELSKLKMKFSAYLKANPLVTLEPIHPVLEKHLEEAERWDGLA